MAAPFRKIEQPMVMMMRLVTDTWRSGASVSRSSASPTRLTLTTAPAQARTSGSPARVNATAVMPPSVTNSPCAKLIASVALKTVLKPSAMRA